MILGYSSETNLMQMQRKWFPSTSDAGFFLFPNATAVDTSEKFSASSQSDVEHPSSSSNLQLVQDALSMKYLVSSEATDVASSIGASTTSSTSETTSTAPDLSGHKLYCDCSQYLRLVFGWYLSTSGNGTVNEETKTIFDFNTNDANGKSGSANTLASNALELVAVLKKGSLGDVTVQTSFGKGSVVVGERFPFVRNYNNSAIQEFHKAFPGSSPCCQMGDTSSQGQTYPFFLGFLDPENPAAIPTRKIFPNKRNILFSNRTTILVQDAEIHPEMALFQHSYVSTQKRFLFPPPPAYKNSTTTCPHLQHTCSVDRTVQMMEFGASGQSVSANYRSAKGDPETIRKDMLASLEMQGELKGDSLGNNTSSSTVRRQLTSTGGVNSTNNSNNIDNSGSVGLHSNSASAANEVDQESFLVLPLSARTRAWDSLPSNFDNFIHGLMTLFEVATLEGWVDILYRAQDVIDKNMGPCRGASAYVASFFFVMYIFVCAFFALNLFVSVVIENFQVQVHQHAKHDKTQENFISHIRWCCSEKLVSS